MTYVGFFLGAMGADYYPRLTEVIHDKVAAVRLMNDQAQLGLAIGGPVFCCSLGWHRGLSLFFIQLNSSPQYRSCSGRWLAMCSSWQVGHSAFPSSPQA